MLFSLLVLDDVLVLDYIYIWTSREEECAGFTFSFHEHDKYIHAIGAPQLFHKKQFRKCHCVTFLRAPEDRLLEGCAATLSSAMVDYTGWFFSM